MSQQQSTDAVMANAGDKIMTLMGMFQQLASGLVGYRRTLVDGGVSPDAADLMVGELHRFVLSRMNSTADNGAKDPLQTIRDAMKRQRGPGK